MNVVRSVGSRFDIAKSTLFSCFFRVVSALNEIAPLIIQWPDAAERRIITQKFKKNGEFEGVIGAIDGTYIPIRAPKKQPEVYINRKCFYGITLQAITTYDMRFIDCFAGYPSSASDTRIYRNSHIVKQIEENPTQYFSNGEYMLGDKAYPVSQYCIPPYIERGTFGNEQKQFNKLHAQVRQIVERSFALLFGRFRRLRYLDMWRTDLIPSTIIACCTLHNICLSGSKSLRKKLLKEGRKHRIPIRDNSQTNETLEEGDNEAMRTKIFNDFHVRKIIT